jgi:GNAT superfamily N-acetyltransferase
MAEHLRFSLRVATEDDIPALRALVDASVRGLHVHDYTPAQIEGALGTALGVDTQLIRDRTFFIANALADAAVGPMAMAGCGGWSNRRTLFGDDRGPGREPELLDPAADAARIRAIFVHPAYARQGLGSLILAHVEAEAVAAGFRRFEMGSTLTGVPLYRLRGYAEIGRIDVPLANGEVVTVVKMVKNAG